MTVIHPDDRAMVNDATAAAIATRQPYVVDYRIIHRDGSIRWSPGQAGKPQPGSKAGQPLFLDGVVFDVTERKRSEDRLSSEVGRTGEEREAAFEAWSRTFPASSIAASSMPTGPTSTSSDYSETLTGYPASDFFDRRVRSYASIHPS